MRALVVDDSRAMRSVLARFLRELGYDVVEAGDGAQALDVLASQRHPVDVALVDWNMPVMDGYEFIKALRAQRRFSMTTVVVVSAENDRSKIARALIAGADEYVMKPITREIIASKLALVGRA